MNADLDVAVLARLVARQVEKEPDRLAFIFENNGLPDELVYYRDLAIRGNQLAHELRRAGLRAGDRVGIMLRNHPEFVYGLVANSKLGLLNVSIDPRTRGEKLRYLLDFAGCTALITADYVIADERAADVIRQSGTKTYVLSTPEGRSDGLDSSGKWPSLNEVLDGRERKDIGQHVHSLETPWLLAFTSGTTGDPKGILFEYQRMVFFQHLPKFFSYREDDIPYTGLSLSHGNALVVTMLPSILGAVQHSVFSRWFTKTRLWDVCRKYGCTSWPNLGGIASAIYSEPPSSKDRAHRVRLVLSAGMPRELWEPFEARFGVKILEWYGTTEGIAFAYNPVGVGPTGSFGKPPEGLIEMQVVNEEDAPVPPGEIGELIARPVGQQAKLEYYKNPEASETKIRGGWLRTGDMCSRDEDGWLFFAFRKEEGGIRRMGEFISEGFIRRVLAEESDVLDVHIYGVPSRSGAPGEKDIVAAIVVRNKDNFRPERLFERCQSSLERSHVPDYFQVIDEIEKTSSGKVQTRFLAEKFGPGQPYIFASHEVKAARARPSTAGPATS